MSDETVNRAIEVVLSGGIIIYPTDTAFGVGCRIDDKKAVDRLFHIRKRSLEQAMPVLVSSKNSALAYYDSPSDIVRHLMECHWPGALTIVERCKKNLIYSPIRGGSDTIGLRWPHHADLQKILEGVGVPITGSSANFHGGKTPYTLSDLDPELVKLVDFVVPGVCPVGNVSTVVDCSVTPYKIIRQGAVLL